MNILERNIKLLNKLGKLFNDDNTEINELIKYLNDNNIKYSLELKNNGLLIELI